jgi:DNA-binding CsgD family transcriptional regulator
MEIQNEESLGAGDVVRIYRLIHQLCEMGADASLWRQRMMAEVEELIDATMSVCYAMHSSLDPADIGPKTVLYIERGTNAAWARYLARGDVTRDPMTPHIMARFGTNFCVMREDFIDDATWYASDYYRDVRVPSDMDSTIYSQVGIKEPSVIDGISFCRKIGQPRFSPRDVALVRFLHQELALLWNRQDPVGIHVLPARQREVLGGIRRGETRKEIAKNMGVSEHTVHSYEKALYERAGVSSRGALLARMGELIRPNLLP